jgi:hypothetical protein
MIEEALAHLTVDAPKQISESMNCHLVYEHDMGRKK